MGGHHGGQQRPHRGLCARNDPKGPSQKDAGKIGNQGQTRHDETRLPRRGHVQLHAVAGHEALEISVRAEHPGEVRGGVFPPESNQSDRRDHDEKQEGRGHLGDGRESQGTRGQDPEAGGKDKCLGCSSCHPVMLRRAFVAELAGIGIANVETHARTCDQAQWIILPFYAHVT